MNIFRVSTLSSPKNSLKLKSSQTYPVTPLWPFLQSVRAFHNVHKHIIYNRGQNASKLCGIFVTVVQNNIIK